jgi:hypothetical protein
VGETPTASLFINKDVSIVLMLNFGGKVFDSLLGLTLVYEDKPKYILNSYQQSPSNTSFHQD